MAFNRVKVQVDLAVGYRNAGWATSNPKAKASWANQTFQASAHQIQDVPRRLEEENTQSKSTAGEY